MRNTNGSKNEKGAAPGDGVHAFNRSVCRDIRSIRGEERRWGDTRPGTDGGLLRSLRQRDAGPGG